MATSSAPGASPSASPANSTGGSEMEVPDYSGPRRMPASVSGPMLWPTSTSVTVWDGGADDDISLYGFVGVTGKLVVPERYEGYAYCRDAAGRVSFVVATATGKKADVLDLTGKVIAHAPSQEASCGPPGLVVFTRVIDSESGNVLDGIMDVTSGAILLPHAAGRKVAVVHAGTVDVTEKKGTYFLNPRTGKRTPHPGWVTDAGLEPGAPGLPASTVRPNQSEAGLSGYVGLNGKWLAKPSFTEASAFQNGYAVVQSAESRYTFLDTRFHRSGGEWDSIDRVESRVSDGWKVVGYLVSGDAGQSLLGPDLRVIIAPGAATIACSWDGNGACSAVAADRSASLVVLPEGTVTAMPAGFTVAVSGSFAADKVVTDDDDNGASRVVALRSGNALALDGPSSCQAVATAWVVCKPFSQVLPPVVIDAGGRRTAFATAEAVDDPTSSGGAAYYWVVAGRYQGFIDASGAWRYRESRYTRVEE